ncbi:Putative sulfatase, alkaline-phosphatase-like, core domain superfamily [Septoria linicola]|uniref:Arylsulfatase n=1 Tax=Septoria linicola TaxID=215465 RepID=A0A9Q9EMG1_9PEZI|nr:putative sulfatase, alkaline-phosphatase-like, core domain superfamily [Septoria linicola]USW54408.1 Putative sulfatase, alkaline-phosphatase-like, core domain superfamily [Septoria linicola]
MMLQRLFVALWALSATAHAKASTQANIIVVLTDDQDNWGSLDYMPLLRKYIADQGTTFDRHYCTVSICCPSRVNIWTGRAAHNTNVTDLFPPYGGYPVFARNGLNENWLPVWLQAEGYRTYYTGKLFNSHTVENFNDPPVNGFNGSDFLLDPYTYSYWKSKMSRNHAQPVSYHGQYSPDVVANKTYEWLDEAASHDDPFFIVAAPIAPHSNQDPDVPGVMGLPEYAPRHAHLFKDYKVPRVANFNPDVPSGVSWVKDLPQLNETVIEYHDEFQRSRLRALQSVDEMVEQLVTRLGKHGLLENTYIIYTTDNGYHVSQHRLPPGKECPFETDIHIPLIVRGPGIPAGRIAGVVSSHTDLTPTILKLAGKIRSDLDGAPIPLSQDELTAPESGEHVNVEFWGRALPEGKYGKIGNDTLRPGSRPVAARNNTYKALRVIGDEYNLLYTVWCTGEKELYDVHRDPHQVRNLLAQGKIATPSDYHLAGRSLMDVVSRLDALLLVLKSCKSRSCHKPWETLHPNSEVTTLKDALRTRYDAFYELQPKVSFSSCPLGHLISEEGPQTANVWNGHFMDGELQTPPYGSQKPLQYYGHWSWYT